MASIDDATSCQLSSCESMKLKPRRRTLSEGDVDCVVRDVVETPLWRHWHACDVEGEAYECERERLPHADALAAIGLCSRQHAREIIDRANETDDEVAWLREHIEDAHDELKSLKARLQRASEREANMIAALTEFRQLQSTDEVTNSSSSSNSTAGRDRTPLIHLGAYDCALCPVESESPASPLGLVSSSQSEERYHHRYNDLDSEPLPPLFAELYDDDPLDLAAERDMEGFLLCLTLDDSEGSDDVFERMARHMLLLQDDDDDGCSDNGVGVVDTV